MAIEYFKIKEGAGGTVSYSAAGARKPSKYGTATEYLDRPYAYVVVTPRSFRNNFFSDGPDWINKDGAETLFEEIPPVVDAAFSDTSMRHTVPTLLAMAHNQEGPLTATHDLSKHSSKLVKKAVSMGVAKTHRDNPSAEATNTLGFTETFTNDKNLQQLGAVAVPQEDVARAKQTVRSLLRPQKERMNVLHGPQFQQLQLPGMEGM